MKIPIFHFDDHIEIINLGDIHRGDHACNIGLFHKTVAYIRDNPNVYWLSTGDIFNVAINGCPTSVYSSMILDEEYDLIHKELGSITSKCLGITKSNHHARIFKAVGMCLDRLTSRELNIPFYGAFGILNVVCGRLSYIIVMHHGVGGGRQIGAKANNLSRLGLIYQGADIYLEGHTHTYHSFQKTPRIVDRKRNTMKEIKQHYCCTGHCLNYEPSYGADQKYEPAPMGFAHLMLTGNPVGNEQRKKVIINLFD